MRIKILSPQLANQIAAGEVVARPASAVKELMENSLDAGAKQIIIEIKKGGHDFISIRDDGGGVMKEDLPLALARHATSKIEQLSDLEQIHSLGFRGEALASIGAVSRLKFTSRHHEAETAWSVQSDAPQDPEPAAHPVGTTVEVHDLFFNTPARRKFLRQPATEFEQIESVVHQLALSHFDVGFRLIHNERQIFSAPAAKTRAESEQRIAAILGSAFIEEAIFIEFAANGLQLRGWIAQPVFNRSQTDMQYWYLNSRFVRDKLLSHAVRQSYEDVLFNGRHPAYILYLSCDPSAVDVNVHPTKHEVRFRDGRTVHQFIAHAVHEALEKIRPAAVIPAAAHEVSSVLSETSSLEICRDFASVKPAPLNYVQQQPLDFSVQELEPQTQLTSPLPLPRERGRGESNNSLGTALAQLRNTYILAQNEQGLVIVDVHAAHERLTYEKMKHEQREQGATQSLLTPIPIALSRQEMQTWESHQEHLTAAGVITEASGPETILVREIPVILQKTDIAQIIRDVLADLITHSTSPRIVETIHEILGNRACRDSIRANHPLTITEMNAMLRQMEQTSNSSHCNHGRPTWKQIPWNELDRFFLRGR